MTAAFIIFTNKHECGHADLRIGPIRPAYQLSSRTMI